MKVRDVKHKGTDRFSPTPLLPKSQSECGSASDLVGSRPRPAIIEQIGLTSGRRRKQAHGDDKRRRQVTHSFSHELPQTCCERVAFRPSIARRRIYPLGDIPSTSC